MIQPPAFALRPQAADDVAAALDALVATSGSAGHPHVRRLAQVRADTPRELVADTLHYLCILHGRQPSLAEMAARLGDTLVPHGWLDGAAAAFATERAWISQLSVTAGAPPAEPGQISTEELVAGQRQALITLVRSDRRGCLLGAIAATLLDWEAVKEALASIGERVGVPLARSAGGWPARAETLAIIHKATGNEPLIGRAILFAAQQVVAQQRAFWDLLDARHAVRIA